MEPLARAVRKSSGLKIDAWELFAGFVNILRILKSVPGGYRALRNFLRMLADFTRLIQNDHFNSLSTLRRGDFHSRVFPMFGLGA